MKTIWTGTDSLFLVKFPRQLKLTKIFYVMALRVFAWLSDIFTQEHYVCGELVEKNILQFGMKKRVRRFQDMLFYPNKIEKISHEGFNILYYYPKRASTFDQWLYGQDVYNGIVIELMDYDDIKFIVVDGTQDMNNIYPIIDVLIRPNRHDGHPRMVDECKLNDIPYIWENKNPSVEDFKNRILNVLNNKNYEKK